MTEIGPASATAFLVEDGVAKLCQVAYEISASKGFHDQPRNKGEMIALMHSELSEALEAIRKPAVSEKIPEFSELEEELADVMIRVADFAHAFELDLGRAITAKMRFNAGRPHKHGKAF